MKAPRLSPWFWELMESVGPEALRNDRDALTVRFRALPRQRLLAFHRQFDRASGHVNPVNRSDFRSREGNLGEDSGDDWAAWMVCRGRAAWDEVRRHPTTFQRHLDDFFRAEWSVRPDYVAAAVFEERFDEEILDVLYWSKQEAPRLTAKDFWSVLWVLIEQAEGSEEKLAALLAAEPRPVLVAFYKEYCRAMGNLKKHLDAPGSEDMQKDIFSHVVSRGRELYDEVLAHPERLPQNVGPGDVELYGVAGRVFWERFEDEITLQ
jgi:hypothetical protein